MENSASPDEGLRCRDVGFARKRAPLRDLFSDVRVEFLGCAADGGGSVERNTLCDIRQMQDLHVPLVVLRQDRSPAGARLR